MHLAGFTNREIADQLSCVERTVERKLSMLRDRWQRLATENIESNVDAESPRHPSLA
jgi:FixJ family two-component response regulator